MMEIKDIIKTDPEIRLLLSLLKPLQTQEKCHCGDPIFNKRLKLCRDCYDKIKQEALETEHPEICRGDDREE